MPWTHDGTVRNALWIGGGQWAGKTTVADLLTDRHHLVHYHYDYHDARGHEDRRIAARLRRARKAAEHAGAAGAHPAKGAAEPLGTRAATDPATPNAARTAKDPATPVTAHTATDPATPVTAHTATDPATPVTAHTATDPASPVTAHTAAEAATPPGVCAAEAATRTTGCLMRDVLETEWEAVWIRPSPAEMAEGVLAGFPERFGWVLDDLRGIVTPHPVLVDGWGLRPELVAAIADPARMVVLAPTEPWRRHQAAALPRARYVSHPVSDPELAARNRFERDRLITEDAVRQAHRHGIRVIEVDGTRPADDIADEVADHFRPFLS